MPTDSLIDTDRAVAAMAAELERLREERDALRAALKPIVDCYGVGYRDPAKFCRDVEDFMLAARAALGEPR